MRIAGILCEYNPFHLGHESQIKAVKQRTDYLVCLMSGSFVQRGEPAIFDKFNRARWALAAGADAVFELPCLYSLQSAEGFAQGGMRLFDQIGIDTLYFGSECNLESLLNLADEYESQSPAFTDALRQYLEAGISYAAAKERAARRIAPALPDSLFMRNAMLGVEYILALRSIRSSIKPVALERFGSISASRIRLILSGSGKESPARCTLTDLIPPYVSDDIASLAAITSKNLSQALLYRLRTMDVEEFASLPCISEGLENRLYHAARQAVSYDEFLKLAAHRRMPLSRIKRALMCILLCISDGTYARYKKSGPQYLRLLGMRNDSANLIAQIKAHSTVPVITQPARHAMDEMLKIDLRATDIHALVSNLPAGLDYTSRLITVP